VIRGDGSNKAEKIKTFTVLVLIFFLLSISGFYFIFELEKRAYSRNVHSVVRQFSNSVAQSVKINNVARVKQVLIDSYLVSNVAWVTVRNSEGEELATNDLERSCGYTLGEEKIYYNKEKIGAIRFCYERKSNLNFIYYLAASLILTFVLSLIVYFLVVIIHRSTYIQAKKVSDSEKVPKFVRYKMHNLRKPIVDLSSEIKILTSLPPSELMSGIRDLSEFMLNICKDLDFSLNRISCLAGEIKLAKSTTNLTEQISEAVKKCELRFKKNKVRFTQQLNHINKIFCDAMFIQDSIFNILINAVEAGADKIEIISEQKENIILIFIRNNGPQLAYSNPFDINTTSKRDGGLGLACVRDFVEKHGGSVTCRNLSRGVEFSIELPSIEEKEAFGGTGPGQGKFTSEEVQTKPESVKPFFIVVDDDALHLKRWEKLYSSTNVDLITFSGPYELEEGIECDKSLLGASCIILDYYIGDKNIFEYKFMELLQSGSRFGYNYQSPVFLSTAEHRIDPENLKKFHDNIGKVPLNWEELQEKISKATRGTISGGI